MATVDVNGRTLRVSDTGTGPAVVLIHGFPLDGRVWDGVVQRLSTRARVIVPDLRGFGRQTPEDAFTMSDLADDVATLMEMVGVAPCPVVGLSMGGYVVQALIKKYPGIASRVILVDTKAEADSAEAKAKRDATAELAMTGGAKAVADQMIAGMTADAPPPAVVSALRSIMDSQPPKTLAAALRAMRDRDDATATLRDSESPVDWVFGKDDKISPANAIEPLVRPGKDSLTLIDKAGHMSPVEQPQAVADAIGKLL